MKPCRDQQCRRSGQLLTESEFPVNRFLKSGRGIYCLECCRRRQAEFRRRKGARQRRPRRSDEPGRKPMVIIGNGFALSMVYDAIQKGCKTRQEIHEETGLSYDDIGSALVELVWECKAVRIQEREFHLAA